ncbi:MAG: hypothetical protein JWP55_2843 [Mycobacterium sp.]|nr:hypothetical protein [Mycobacterium sp.]
MSVALTMMRACTSRVQLTKGFEMTGLGAALYGGFFALAALWLFMTSDAGSGSSDDQGQNPERSNSTNTPAAAESFSPDWVSHS